MAKGTLMLYIVVRDIEHPLGRCVEILEVYTNPLDAETYRRKCQDTSPQQSFQVIPKKIKT